MGRALAAWLLVGSALAAPSATPREVVEAAGARGVALGRECSGGAIWDAGGGRGVGRDARGERTPRREPQRPRDGADAPTSCPTAGRDHAARGRPLRLRGSGAAHAAALLGGANIGGAR